jgi:hypothetical protein
MANNIAFQDRRPKAVYDSTRLCDRVVLDPAASLFRTHLEAIDKTLALVKETARELAQTA